jgi:hypothetical protein
MKYLSFLTLSAAAIIAAPTFAGPPKPSDEIQIESFAEAPDMLNVETGALMVTKMGEGAWSSHWYFQAGDPGFMEIKNRWTGCYLHVQNGELECGERQKGWWSSQWKIDSYDDLTAITNRWTGCKIFAQGNRPGCDKGDAGKRMQWNLLNMPERAKPAASKDPSAQSRANRIQNVQNQRTVWLQSSDGDFADQYIFTGLGEIPLFSEDWNDDIEALRVTTEEVTVTLYEHANFQGRKIVLTCGSYELIGDPENEISSMKVEFRETEVTKPHGCTHDQKRRPITSWR